MRKSSKLVSILLLIAIMLPGIANAANVDNLEEMNMEDAPVAMSSKSSENNNYIQRIQGKNRVATSIAVSKEAYKGKAKKVLLAGHDGQADALTATFVAGQEDAPLLLTYQDRVTDELLQELKRLSPESIVILGGENVVGKNVESQLGKEGFNVKRIEGSSRVQTAINVASDYYDHKSGISKASKVFVIEYNSLVDALAIGPVAARDGIPILIMRKDSVPEELSKYLKEQGITQATIVGGESRISQKGKANLEALGMKVGRISGSNRIQTSINICNEYFKTRNSTVIANGHRYTDALIGGYFAAKKNAPIILTDEGRVPDSALHCISEVGVKSYVLGGEAVVSGKMFNTVKAKLDPNYSLPEPVKPAPKPEPEKPAPEKPAPKPEPETKPETKQYHTTVNLNMRSGGGTSHGVVLTIPKGAEIGFLSQEGGWSKVIYNNKEGYVSSAYIKSGLAPKDEPAKPAPKPETKPETSQYHTTVNLNMRSGPGTSNAVVLTIPKGAEIGFLSQHGDWSKVVYNKKEGYVSNSYIKSGLAPKPVTPKPGQKIVCFDYGHGGGDIGAPLRNSSGTVIRREKDDTLKVGMLVAQDLRRHGVTVDETRTNDKTLSLAQRANFENRKNYDYFVSFHRNAFSSSLANGVEVWTANPGDTKSTRLANALQRNLVRVGFTDRKVKRKNFYVLRYTKAPAALIELGFITNEKDNQIHDSKQNEIVRGISSAILEQLGIPYKN